MDEQVFARAEEFARRLFEGDSGGHDIYHPARVCSLACALCEEEGGDMDVVRLAALLHDVDDPKLFGGEGLPNASRFMESEGIPEEVASEVRGIISSMSFKGTGKDVPASLEGRIVQDADRLDAIGAIGVARAFAYGGSKGRPMHVPGEGPRSFADESEYRSSVGTTVNHFHEKLLKLQGLMNTDSARRMAEARHRYMEGFLEEFMAEWDGLRRGYGCHHTINVGIIRISNQ